MTSCMSVPIHSTHRRYPFQWEEQAGNFRPCHSVWAVHHAYVFTKLLKPAVAMLHRLGEVSPVFGRYGGCSSPHREWWSHCHSRKSSHSTIGPDISPVSVWEIAKILSFMISVLPAILPILPEYREAEDPSTRAEVLRCQDHLNWGAQVRPALVNKRDGEAEWTQHTDPTAGHSVRIRRIKKRMGSQPSGSEYRRSMDSGRAETSHQLSQFTCSS